MSRFVDRARYGYALRQAALDGPGLVTVQRARQLFVRGKTTWEELGESLEVALRRPARVDLPLLTNEQIDNLPPLDPVP